jgi:hypothetical protein
MKKIISLLKSVWAFITGLSKKYIPLAVTIVQGIKKAIENGNLDITAGVLKSLIPGDVDDIIIEKVVTFLKKRIPVWCEKLEITQDALNELTGEKWAEFTSGIAGEIASHLSGDMLDPIASAKEAKMYYDINIKKAA